MKSIVVFYTRTGNTKKVAESIMSQLQAESEELVDKKKRSGILGWLRSGWDSFRENLTDLKPIQHDPEEYELVIVGTPNWARNMTPAVRTYLVEHKDEIPKVAFFCTQGGKGGEGLIESLGEICEKDPVATLIVSKDEVNNDSYQDKVEEFVREI